MIFQKARSVDAKVSAVALHLRKVILDLRKEYTELPYPFTAETANRGQAEKPHISNKFSVYCLLASLTLPMSQKELSITSSLLLMMQSV